MKTTDEKMDFWLEQNLNVLLVGGHGIGKTALVANCFNRRNLKWRYFSAATMDPWVDFIGVPKEKTEPDGTSHLDLIRPRDFQDDTIEALFFDEFNRAPAKVRNAVMELIQFKSINGREFKNLRFIWAAINPPDDNETYNVEPLDPAQQDRFHIYYTLPDEPSEKYFIDKFGDHIGGRAVKWWKGIPEDVRHHVSPRRLDYAVEIYTKGGDLDDVLAPEVRPKTLKRSIEAIEASMTHTERWIANGDAYLQELKSRRSTVDVVAAFAELGQMSMDQAVEYVQQLPANKLNEIASHDSTIGILVRACWETPTSRTLITAINTIPTTKISEDSTITYLRTKASVNSKLYDTILNVYDVPPVGIKRSGWDSVYRIMYADITSNTLSYTDAALLLTLYGLIDAGSDKRPPTAFDSFIKSDKRPPTAVVDLFCYVERTYPSNLLEFVKHNPLLLSHRDKTT